MTQTFFYVVGDHGIPHLSVAKLLTPYRPIRWDSACAEYGLIEARIVECDNPFAPIVIRDTDRDAHSAIHIERVAEVALTEEEARSFGFGWPLSR